MSKFGKEYKLFYFDQVEIDTPLKEINFNGTLVNNYLNMEVKQIYKNIYDTNCEFIYVFPLPKNASITSFNARIGDKIIVGKIERKNKAEKKYKNAKKNGDITSLLRQLGKDVFQISLGNIPKDTEIEISLSYLEKILSVDGSQEIVLPCKISERYFNSEADILGEKDKAILGIEYGEIETIVNYSLSLNSFKKITSVESFSHTIKIENSPEGTLITTFGEKPNKDFSISISSNDLSDNIVEYWKDENDIYGILNFTPVFKEESIQEPKEYFFLLDISGSMEGKNLFEAKQALKLALKNLEIGDLFNIVSFESSLHPLSDESLAYNQKNLEKAVEYIDNLRALGGTEILPAIKFTLKNRLSDDFPLVAMLFTDGQVCNEDSIVDYLNNNKKNIQFYTFGIDENINRSFLEDLAVVGDGSAEFVFPGERVDKKILRHFFKISCPSKSNILLEEYGLTVMNLPTKFYNGDNYSLYFKTDKPLDNQFSINFEKEDPLKFIELNLTSEVKGRAFKNIYNKEFLVTLENSLKNYSRELEKEKIELATLKRQLSFKDKIFEKLNLKKEVRQEIYKKNIVSLGNTIDMLKKEIINFSLKENILSQETAFIGISKNKNNSFEEYKTVSVPSYRNIFSSMKEIYSMDFDDEMDFCEMSETFRDATPSYSNSLFREKKFCEIDYSDELENYNSSTTFENDNLFQHNYPSARRLILSSNDTFIDDFIGELDEFQEIALKQNIDGSFGGSNSLEEIIEETIHSVKTLLKSEDKDIYKKQIEKGIKYLKVHGRDMDFMTSPQKSIQTS